MAEAQRKSVIDRLADMAVTLRDVGLSVIDAGGKAVESVSRQVKAVKATIREEREQLETYKSDRPDLFAKNWHLLGKEMPPTKIKYLEAAAALLLGINGIRTTWYGLNAATDTVPEKGQPAGFFRNVSGYIRAAMGIAQLGITAALGLHAFNLNAPDPRTIEL